MPSEPKDGGLAPNADPFADLHFFDTDFDFSAYEPQMEPDRDRFNEMLTGVVATPDFTGGRKNGMDLLWLGDEFLDTRWTTPRQM